MKKSIILCDHDTKWTYKFADIISNIDDSVNIIYAESLEEASEIIQDTSTLFVLVFSVFETEDYIYERIRSREYKIIKDRNIPIVIIADNASEKEEMLAMETGCAEYQGRQRPISIIAYRVLHIFDLISEKIATGEQSNDGKMLSKDIINTLTIHEKSVLEILMENQGEIVWKRDIQLKVWGEKLKEDSRVLDTVLKQLRRKLKGSGFEIVSVYGGKLYIKKEFRNYMYIER